MVEILLTRDTQAFYAAADPPLVRRLNRCFDQLEQDPYQHPNIKRLKGDLAGYWRYRLGDWRVVYRVDQDARTVTVITNAHRSQVYR